MKWDQALDQLQAPGVVAIHQDVDCPRVEIESEAVLAYMSFLHQQGFEVLVDLCGVDYLSYGEVDWMTESATATGFDRGRLMENKVVHPWKNKRFGVIYHFLSLEKNLRVRIVAYLDLESLSFSSITSIYPPANWFEREAYDLFGIVFTGHPALERILTDCQFTEFPMRKDFPVIGKTEIRYDKAKSKIVHEPVTSVTERTIVPKVIRT